MEKRTYKQLLKQKSFIAYAFANVLNRLGDSLDSIAFVWIVYAITNNPVWSAAIFGINRLPTILLQPFLGVFVDKLNKKFVLIFTDLIRASCVAFVLIGYSQGWLNVVHLIITTLIISSAEAFRLPTSTAMLPHLLKSEDYEYGVSLNQGLQGTVELIGLGSVGFIIGIFGIHTALIIDMFAFIGCSLVMIFVRYKPIKVKQGDTKSSFITDFGEGINIIKGSKIIIYIISLAIILNGIMTPFNAFQIPLIKEILKSPDQMISVIGISFAFGSILGSIAFPKINERINEFQLVKIGGLALIIIYVAPLVIGRISSNVLLTSVLLFISLSTSGFLITLLNTYANVLLVKIVAPNFLGRVNAILIASCQAATPVISFIASGIVVWMGVKGIFIGCVVLSIVAYFTFMSKKVYKNMVQDEFEKFNLMEKVQYEN